MAETKVYAIPADWTQPAFTLGETVYYVADRPREAPIPGQIVGLVYRGGEWIYLINFEGYGPECEFCADTLTREVWEYTSAPALVRPVHDDFDPFLDAYDDLP